FDLPFENFFKLSFEISERVRDRNLEKFDSKIEREGASIIDAPTGRVGTRHGNASYILSSERIHRDDGSDRGIDSAAEADHRRMEVALAKIIANSQRKRREKFLRRFVFVKLNCSRGICIDDLLVLAKRRQLRNQAAGSIHGN